MNPKTRTHPGKRFTVVVTRLPPPGVAHSAHRQQVTLIGTIDEDFCGDRNDTPLLGLGNGATGFIDGGVIEDDRLDRIIFVLGGNLLAHRNRLLAGGLIKGLVPYLDFTDSVFVDHSDSLILYQLFESLPILFIADAMFGMPSMGSFLFFQSLHQDFVGGATHRFSFTPVQVVDPSTSHSTQGSGGLNQDYLGTFFFRCECRHDATGRTPIHTDIRFVIFTICSSTD